jgi:hypothetical protein
LCQQLPANTELFCHYPLRRRTDILICFEGLWSADQAGRILNLLQSRPMRTPRASLTLARLYHRLKQDDNARDELLHARALLHTIAQYSDLETKVRNLAKELGNEQLAAEPIEPRVLEELGFIELKAGIQIPSQEIGMEEPVHFYVKTPDGSLKTISLRIIKSATTNGDPMHIGICSG